jgi:hypothetical protein
MDEAAARNIANYSHIDLRDRHGDLVIDHVARVAAAVPPDVRALAWLHDVFEASPTTAQELLDEGMSPLEIDALRLLTRDPEESYESYALRIAFAPGEAGRLARVVKLADLDDHLQHEWVSGSPPYGWARRHIAAAMAREATPIG